MKWTLFLVVWFAILALSQARKYDSRYSRMRSANCRVLCNQFVRNMKTKLDALMVITDGIVQNATVVKGFSEEFCKLRAPGQRACYDLMRNYEVIFDGIQKGADTVDICRKISACRQKKNRKNWKQKTRATWSPAKKCEICKAVIKVVDTSVQIFNYTEMRIDQLVMMSCKFVSRWREAKQECQHIVQQIIRAEKLLVKDLEPGDVCAVLGYCNYSAIAKEKQEGRPDECGVAKKISAFSPFRVAFTFVKNFVPSLIDKIRSNQSLGEMVKRTALVSTVSKCMEKMDAVSTAGKRRAARSIQGQSRCQVCSVLSEGMLSKVSNDDQDILGLRENLGKVCTAVKSEGAKHRCRVISAIVGNPLSMIADVVTPEVCNSLPCSLLTDKGQLTNNGRACEICKLVAKIVGSETKYIGRTIDMVANEVEEICKEFGSEEASAVCSKVTSTLKKLTTFLEKKFSVDSICKKIGVCTNQPALKQEQKA